LVSLRASIRTFGRKRFERRKESLDPFLDMTHFLDQKKVQDEKRRKRIPSRPLIPSVFTPTPQPTTPLRDISSSPSDRKLKKKEKKKRDKEKTEKKIDKHKRIEELRRERLERERVERERVAVLMGSRRVPNPSNTPKGYSNTYVRYSGGVLRSFQK